MKGAGGTDGGFWRFIIGFAMMIGGGYLFFDSIHVSSGFGMGRGLYSMGGMNITTGFILFPMIFGIAIVFFSAKNPIGWVLFLGSLLALGFGVIRSMNFRFAHMSALSLIIILVMLVGGIGLMLSSMRDMSKEERLE